MIDKKVTRRAFVRGFALSGAALAAGVIPIQAVQAQSASKESMKYQDSPKDGKKCDMCVYFKAPNACSLVQGDISPNGWCTAFTPKG
jgi:hypothetical protein